MRFEFQHWLLKRSEFHVKVNKGKPIPMLVMVGKILRETDKSYLLEVRGKPEPTDFCLHCGRKLKNMVSRYYGLGPVCGQHYYITNITKENLEANFDEIRKKMANIYWQGWIPKSSVTITMEKYHNIAFTFGGQQYSVTTADETKIKEIYEKADAVLMDTVQEA